MSFLRRLRRDKDPTPPESEPKEPPAEEPKEEEVRVYGADDLPSAPPPSQGSTVEESAPDVARPETPSEPAPVPPLPPTDPVLSAPTVEPLPSPSSPAAPPAPSVSVLRAAPDGPPPPLPDPGPVSHPRTPVPIGGDSSCFVCGTPLVDRHCSVCQMTWAE